MSQRQYRRVDKNESQTQNNNPRRPGRGGRSNPVAQPHHQWISSAEGVRGGGGDRTCVPPAPPQYRSHPHSSTGYRFKKSTTQGRQLRETDAGVSIDTEIVQKTRTTKPELSEVFDASIAEGHSKSTVPCRQGDGSEAASPKSSHRIPSAAPTTTLRGEPSAGVSLEFGSLNSGLLDGNREATESTSSTSIKQKSKGDMDQAKSEIFHLQLKAKRDVCSPYSSSKQRKYNCSKPIATLSTSCTYGKLQVEDAKQVPDETPRHQPEAKRDMHVQEVSLAPAVNGTQEVSLPFTGVSVPTSSFQQPNFQLQFGISSLQTWSQGMASASLQMPVQSVIVDSSQLQQPAIFPSFQPYSLQPQEVMHYSQGVNFPFPVGHQLDSQFVNFNVIPSLYVQDDVRNGIPRRPVKITHPETKEELKLDELAKAKLNLKVHMQEPPLAYVQSHSMNYFSHMQPNPFSLHSPASVTVSSTEMFPTSAKLGFDYLDMRGAVGWPNLGQASSSSIPSSSQPALGYAGQSFSSPVSIRSAVNGKNAAIKITRPLSVSSGQGKSKICSEIFVKPPQNVVTKAEVPSAKSTHAVSFEGVFIGEAVTDDGKKTAVAGDSGFVTEELQNLGKNDSIQSQQLPQAKSPKIPGNSEMASLEVRKSPGDISASLTEPKLSAINPGPALNLENSISGRAKLETIKFEATSSLADTSAGASISHANAGNTRKVEFHQNLKSADTESIEVKGKKRYSRDFLLTFSSLFVELPTDFELVTDMVKGLILGSQAQDDRQNRVEDDSKCKKTLDTCASEEDQQFGITRGNFGVHSSREGTYGRNLIGQTPDHCDVGLITGSLPHSRSHGGRKNKGPNADRWQQGKNLDTGLISWPQSPLQAMHKAERKYEVHKVFDGEEAKQRQLKAALNKLTPQNFDRLFQQVKEVNIDNATTLSGLISQIFDKALMEPTFCEMYAKFCSHLASELPNFVEGDEKITFKRLLLNKCQEEFVKGETEQQEANRIEEEGEARLSEGKREENRIRVRRRMLGNIRLIGELYKKKMLTERVIHECINKLLGDYDHPDEEDIEALCKLMSTVGEMIDHPKAKELIDAYFEVMKNLSNNNELSLRMRFMLQDVIDLRKDKWQQRRKVEGPKKIEELHSDAAQERQALVSKLTFGPNAVSSKKRVSANLSPRQSTAQSPQYSKLGACHAVTPKIHGFASQDVRLENTHHHKHSTLPVSFPHGSSNETTMNPDCQVDLTKRMSIRGPPMLYGSLLTDLHTDFSESMRMPPNGFSSISEQKQYNLKQHTMPRYAPDIFKQAPGYDHSNNQRHNHIVNKDLSSASCGESKENPLITHSVKPTLSSNVSSRKV